MGVRGIPVVLTRDVADTAAFLIRASAFLTAPPPPPSARGGSRDYIRAHLLISMIYCIHQKAGQSITSKAKPMLNSSYKAQLDTLCPYSFA